MKGLEHDNVVIVLGMVLAVVGGVLATLGTLANIYYDRPFVTSADVGDGAIVSALLLPGVAWLVVWWATGNQPFKSLEAAAVSLVGAP